MKQILIFSHVDRHPPGYYVSTVLDQLDYPYEYICLINGDKHEINLSHVAALVFMGGAGYVNQPTDWMIREMEIIKQADALNIPILGICLGAQLMSKAMGGKVWESDALEIGWHQVKLIETETEHRFLSELPKQFTVFQWHAHTFSPPPGATPVMTSESKACQAYIHGSHLAIQFHLEMTETIIMSLIDLFACDLEEKSPYVNTKNEITDGISDKCANTFKIADRLFSNWLEGIHSSPDNLLKQGAVE